MDTANITRADLLAMFSELATVLKSQDARLRILEEYFSYKGEVHSIRIPVANAGTPVHLLSTDLVVRKLLVQAFSNNQTYVTVGVAGVSGAQATQSGIMLGANDKIELHNVNLYNIWVDSLTNGEGVVILYAI